LENGLDIDAYASVLRRPASGASSRGVELSGSACEWTVLVSAPAYEQLHCGDCLSNVVEQALAAYQRAHVDHGVHGVDDLEFADSAPNVNQAASGASAATLPPAA
jgi:hypothetical protein